jgi:PTH1 family peptidyl-tRNA hydrolase
VVHDELDLPPHVVRVKQGGGEGGHNGLKSISAALGSKDYLRVRCGIGRPPGRMDPADFVLRDFSLGQRRELDLLGDRCADAVEQLLAQGLAATQNQVH